MGEQGLSCLLCIVTEEGEMLSFPAGSGVMEVSRAGLTVESRRASPAPHLLQNSGENAPGLSGTVDVMGVNK